MYTALFVSIHSEQWGEIEEIGMAYVSAKLAQNGHQVHIASCSDDGIKGYDKLTQILQVSQPSIVGIGCSHKQFSLRLYIQISDLIRQESPSSI